MDVERRRNDRGANEQEREQRAERDRHALDEAPDAARVLARERGCICRRSPAVAGDPEDRRARDHERDPGVAVRPERCPRQHGDERDGDEAEADQRPGPIAAVAQGGRGEGIHLPLVGHNEGRRQVDEDARAAEQREDDEADAVDGRVDVEVGASPPQTPASLRSQRLRSRRFVAPLPSVWVLVSVMSPACPAEARSAIRNDPDPTLSRPSRLDAAQASVEVADVILAHDPSPESGGALAVRGCDCKLSYDRPSRARPIRTPRTSDSLSPRKACRHMALAVTEATLGAQQRPPPPLAVAWCPATRARGRPRPAAMSTTRRRRPHSRAWVPRRVASREARRGVARRS